MQSEYLTEWETRKAKIDVALKAAGWNPSDLSMIVQEVDTKQSDFLTRRYRLYKETKGTIGKEEHAYADYLLLDEAERPLAIIEAKKTSRDAVAGQKQAEQYAADIKKQTGEDVFIFLTNGYTTIFWNKPYESTRPVRGFHSSAALERLRFQNKHRQTLLSIPIKSEIIDRPYQIEAVKRIVEGIEKGKRRFLLVQATGTGKTRVAMALIDILLRGNRAEKVLFLTDRVALETQAYSDGFKRFFPNEGKAEIDSSLLVKDARLYVSTIQTLMECYQEFSVGDFDIIISDECHRSIYNKWKDIFTYFDAIKVGLTATPSDLIEHDTFRFFECDDQAPTSAYDFEDAVKDGYLVPYRRHETQTHFQIAGITPKDFDPQVKRELYEKGIDPEELSFDGTEIEKKVVVIGTNEAIVREFMDYCIMDSTGTLPAKTIFFAMTRRHAARIWEAFEKMYPEYKGRLCRVITSDDSRAQTLLDEFKKQDFPRVAISVDMLDTGVDIPEVCNLVFAKPVFSRIKFWQMIGRGTRNDQTCLHKDWIPDGKKTEFLIFDCWNNFEYFKLHPKGVEAKVSESLPGRIFLERLKQLETLLKRGDTENADRVKEKILEDIRCLPTDSIEIRDRQKDVEMALSPKLWDRVGLNPIEFLRKHITPLMRYKTGVNPKEYMFLMNCERFNSSLLDQNKEMMEAYSNEIGKAILSLPKTIDEVKQKEELIDEYTSKIFWAEPSIENVHKIYETFMPLMKYKRGEIVQPIILDIDDYIEKRQIIEYGPSDAPRQDYVAKYREKIENRIKALAENHPTIQKIAKDERLVDNDLVNLEDTLNSPELYITEDTLKKTYGKDRGNLVQFVKKIIGLYEFPDPAKEVENAFQTFIVENNKEYGADQVNFIRAIQTYFITKKHIEYSDLYEPPFINFGKSARMDEEDLKAFIDICSRLEKELFAAEA